MKLKPATPISALWDSARWVILAVVLAGLMLLAVIFSDGRDSVPYNRGHQALVALDCTTAVAEFDDVLDNVRLIDMRGFAYRAAREKDQCQIFQQALELEAAGSPGDAAATYYRLMREYEDSPLYGTAQENLTGIVNAYDLTSLTSEAFCQDFNAMLTGAGVIGLSDPQVYPNIVDACGKMYESTGSYREAIAWYDAYLDGHIADVWTNHFREAVARSMYGEMMQRGAQDLPSPVWVGDHTSSTFVLDIYIVTPSTARVAIAGPATNVFDVKGCPDCEIIPNTGAPGCAGAGKPVRVEMPVGTYQVLIETGAGESMHAYQAAWAMPSGRYELCLSLD